MKAVRIEGAEQCAFHEIDEPVPGDGEVLLNIRHIGLCGSDLATFTQLNPLVVLPRIPGHEIGAAILSVGNNVPARYQPGKAVIVMPYTACGTCSSCRKGRPNACRQNQTLGVQRDGGLTERIVVPHDKLILNETLQPRHLALVEPLSVGFHAVARGRITGSETVAVIGTGMIGMGAVAGAVHRGARVIAIDMGAKTEMALRYGAAHAIDAGSEDVLARINELTSGDGVDVAIEAVGLPQTFRQAVDITGFSGRVVFIGYAKTEVSFDTKYFNLKELDLMGSRNATRDDFDTVITWMESLETPPDDLISKTFTFDQADEALPYWVRNRSDTLKITIER